MFPDPSPAERLAMTSTHYRATERDWLMSVVDQIDGMAEECITGPEEFFSFAGAFELSAAEEIVDEHYADDEEEEEEEASPGAPSGSGA